MNISRTVAIAAIVLSSFPTIAWADKQITRTLNSNNSSHQALMQEAGALAQKLIEQEFSENYHSQAVEVAIVGERNGQEVPLLSAKVSRANWQENPQIQVWAQYFSDSAVLLGFRQERSPANVVRPVQNPAATNKEVAASHLEPNFYK